MRLKSVADAHTVEIPLLTKFKRGDTFEGCMPVDGKPVERETSESKIQLERGEKSHEG